MSTTSDPSARCVLAVDPGSVKCGVAVVSGVGAILHRAVVSTNEVVNEISNAIARFAPTALVVGSGTGSKGLFKRLRTLDPAVAPIAVDEAHTTEAARARWIVDNPPTGLKRLLPASLRMPDRPYDDYVAVILAERYLASTHPPPETSSERLDSEILPPVRDREFNS